MSFDAPPAFLIPYPSPLTHVYPSNALLIDTEPWDEALDRKIWSLMATNLDWHKQLAHQSKTQPQEIEERMRELVEERLAVDAAPAGREEDGEVEVEDVAGEWATSFRTEGSEGRGKGEVRERAGIESIKFCAYKI